MACIQIQTYSHTKPPLGLVIASQILFSSIELSRANYDRRGLPDSETSEEVLIF